jgi:O-antigen/teichoic acid export membrane protein
MEKPDERPAIDAAAVLERFSRRLGGDVLRYLPSVVVPALMSVAFITVFTRIFDPAAFGRYTVVYVTCAILTPLWSGWISQAVIRYLPRYRAGGKIDEFKSMMSALLLAVILVLTALLVLAYPLVGGVLGPYQPYYLPGAVMVVAGVAYQALRALFQANLQSGAYARAEVLFSIGRLAFALVFVLLVARDAVGLIAGPAVSYSLLAIAMIPWHRLPAAVARHQRAFRLTLLPQFLRYGIPLIGWMIGVRLLEMSDRYILGYLRGPEQVGVYAANYGIAAMGISMVATPVLLAAHPLIFGAWEEGGRSHIQDLVRQFSRYYLLAAVPLTAFVVVFAGDIAAVLLGESFRGGHPVVPVVFLGLMLWNLGFYGHKSIKLFEKTGLMFLLVCVCAAVNIGLNFALVPAYGYMGAAVATLIAAGMYPVMVYAVTWRYLPWKVPWASLARIVVAAAIAGAAGAAAAAMVTGAGAVARLVVGLVAGTPVYAVMLAAMREVRSEEFAAVRAFAGRWRG